MNNKIIIKYYLVEKIYYNFQYYILNKIAILIKKKLII